MFIKGIFAKKWGLILAILLPIVVLDQITKQIIHHYFHYNEIMPVIPGLFNITYIGNYGAAWGLLSNSNSALRIPFFWTVSISAIILISGYLHFYVPVTKKLTIITFSLILSGAIGNFLDRIGIFHKGGYVIDFLDFYIGTWHWPAFNVADSSISVAIALLIILTFIEEKQKKRLKKETPPKE